MNSQRIKIIGINGIVVASLAIVVLFLYMAVAHNS